MPPLLRVDPPAYRHHPYQGGQGGSNLKSIFNSIITSYLSNYLLPLAYSGKRLSEIQTKLCLAWFIARDTVPHTTAHRYIAFCLLSFAYPKQEVDFVQCLSIYDR